MPIMKAVVIHEPGGPEVLKVESIPIPTPLAGQVLIRTVGFGVASIQYTDWQHLCLVKGFFE
jgi:NADPH:quinone reductase-like Zn-dependent oxidoreductase